jgi:hypothetical protein
MYLSEAQPRKLASRFDQAPQNPRPGAILPTPNQLSANETQPFSTQATSDFSVVSEKYADVKIAAELLQRRVVMGMANGSLSAVGDTLAGFKQTGAENHILIHDHVRRESAHLKKSASIDRRGDIGEKKALHTRPTRVR